MEFTNSSAIITLDIVNLKFFLSPSKESPLRLWLQTHPLRIRCRDLYPLLQQVLASKKAVILTSEVPRLGVDGGSLLFPCSCGESCSSQKESRRCICSFAKHFTVFWASTWFLNRRGTIQRYFWASINCTFLCTGNEHVAYTPYNRSYGNSIPTRHLYSLF